MAAWTSTNDYATRVTDVANLLAINDDQDVDTLKGEQDQDLFHDGLDDILPDVENDETVL